MRQFVSSQLHENISSTGAQCRCRIGKASHAFGTLAHLRSFAKREYPVQFLLMQLWPLLWVMSDSDQNRRYENEEDEDVCEAMEGIAEKFISQAED